MKIVLFIWLNGEIGRRYRLKIYYSVRNVRVQVPLELLINTYFLSMKWLHYIKDYLDKAIRSNTGVSSLSLIMVAIAFMAIVILMVICFCLIVEVLNAHTISSSLDGYAQIIGAVAALITSVGLPKAINNYGENKFHGKKDME